MTRLSINCFAILAFFIIQESLPAQQLRLHNPGSQSIVMHYRSQSERPKELYRINIPADESVNLTLRGDDPFDVNFTVLVEDGSARGRQSFHVKVGRPVELRRFASIGKVIDVQAAIAQAGDVDAPLIQITSAQLIAQNAVPFNGHVFSTPAAARPSKFLSDVLEKKWRTVYQPINGTGQVRANLSFKELTFETSSFKGRFTDLIVYESENDVYITGWWRALSSSGRVYFFVRKDDRGKLEGRYTSEGGSQEFTWVSE
jgi:hypothetical protein